jgi:hypothetical protein
MTKILCCAVGVGLLVASSSVFARGPGGNNGGTNASQVSPGHLMNSGATPPVTGLHGAAGWAPGHQTSTPTVTAPGNGAAVYAPGFLK